MFNSIFKIVYFIELVLITAVRSAGTTKFRRLKTEQDHSSTLDTILLGVNGIGMIIPIFYVFSSWLDFANYSLPSWLGWVGVVLFAVAAYLLWETHRAMGRNWTPTLGLREEHNLVTGGIFKYIRHPMYAAHILWALATPLILTNWIAGFSMLIPQIVQYWLRVSAEEEMMLDHFGQEYREYMKSTGRIIPRLSSKRSIPLTE
jgi:protein-S-isoprenylcysteine O-methyltransferase Ste14